MVLEQGARLLLIFPRQAPVRMSALSRACNYRMCCSSGGLARDLTGSLSPFTTGTHTRLIRKAFALTRPPTSMAV